VGACLLLCSTTAFATQSTKNKVDNEALIQQKNAAIVPYTGGEIYANQAADACPGTPILGLPFADTGTTCGYVNNYDYACPYTGSTSPDVVYSLVGTGVAVTIDLCNSGYDSKVYVYAGTCGGTPICCNDDACGSDGFRSLIECCPLAAGTTYFIVVDGYGGACGSYDIVVSECGPPCMVDCPPGSLLEGEPDCFDGYLDAYNSGCNAPGQPVFSPIPCDPDGGGVTICGTYGGFIYNGLSYRDTDWYQIIIPPGPNANVTWCVTGELDTLVGRLNGSLGCAAPAFDDYAYGPECTQLCVGPASLAPGPWWFFVATLGFGPSNPCGSDYVATLTGYDCPPISVETTSWGQVKNLYR
jgi:hypothetical protein